MITYVRGNLFESPAQVLVNTVNTVGVMGKGIALQFKRYFPEMFAEYRALCEAGTLAIGRLHLYRTDHKWILNFPTKEDWRRPSRPEYIEQGLKRFAQIYVEAGIHSIAFPPLGCGNGELDFESQVRPLMETHLRTLPIDVFIYPPLPRHELAEHIDAKATAEWLRSEPAALPFAEVWRDLVRILAEQSEFRTAGGGGQFTVRAGAEPRPELVIESAGKRYRIDDQQLLEFWQRLRQHGFASRLTACDHMRLSYLLPIFERLDYVERVALSTTSRGLDHNAAVALQIKPPYRNSLVGSLFPDRAR